MEGSLIQGAGIVVGGSFFGLTPETLIIDAQNHFLDGMTANLLRAEKNNEQASLDSCRHDR